MGWLPRIVTQFAAQERWRVPPSAGAADRSRSPHRRVPFRAGRRRDCRSLCPLHAHQLARVEDSGGVGQPGGGVGSLPDVAVDAVDGFWQADSFCLYMVHELGAYRLEMGRAAIRAALQDQP